MAGSWKHTRTVAAAAIALGAMSASCSGTKTSVTQLWQAPAPRTAPMKKVLVIASRMSETTRRSTEDGFATALARHGVDATPSYRLFPGQLPDRAAARAATEGKGFDGFVVTTLQEVRDRQTFVPGAPATFWGSYYGPGWAGTPSYIVNEEIVKVETTVWDARAGDALVWSATSQTTNPSAGAPIVKSLTDELVPRLASDGLIPPRRDDD